MTKVCDMLPPVRGTYTYGAPLKDLVWFRAGGTAEILFRPADADDLATFLAARPDDVRLSVIGVGSNLLVRDGGIPGVTVRLSSGFGKVETGTKGLSGVQVRAGAAALDAAVARAAADAGIAGLEFLRGVPGTIGGALKMNAGCYGRETKDIFIEATALDARGNKITLTPADMAFVYRKSQTRDELIFIEALFEGSLDQPDAIRARMEELSANREASQPIRSKTGGSTFKNPPGQKAWQLIDQAGCRGLKIGDAQVSEKHCNFLINTGEARAGDIEALGEEVRRRVREKSGVELEWEIKRVGLIQGRGGMSFKRIAVLMGGRSAEREVSLSSGRGVMKALAEEGFDPVMVDPGDNPGDQLFHAKPDAVFNALHGRFGEDGTVQGLLELMRIPYTHSGVLASALAMHKERTKDVYRAAGLPVVKSIVVDRKKAAAGHLMEPPYVVKPVNEGSSVGVFIIRKGDNRPPAALGRDDWNLSSEMMVEEFVPGRELTVSVMGANLLGKDRPLGVTEITTELDFYDYEAKYAAGGSRHIISADLPAKVSAETMALAVRAHQVLGCRGVTRTDFRYDETGASPRLILLETNTQPGMTPTSLVPEQAAHMGISYAKLCRWMVEDASCDR